MPRRLRFAALAAALLAAPSAAPAEGWVAVGAGAPPTPLPGAVDSQGTARLDGSAPLAVASTPAGYLDAPGCGEANPFLAGSTSTQFLVGAYFSGRPGPRIPSFNYLPVTVRLGWMLTDPDQHWWGYGNYECLVDLTAAPIISDYGNYFVGPSFLLRSNWIFPDSPLVPYAQVGIGGVYNDAHKDPFQEAIGHPWEYYLHYELGVKCFLTSNLSVDVEGGVQHLSNGGKADRNLGVNAFGAAVGLTYYFPAGR